MDRDKEIRDGALSELDSKKSNKKPKIVIIDSETKKKFFSFVAKGGQIFSAKAKNPEARDYEII